MNKFVEMCIWGKNWCDDDFMVTNSYGYSLDVLRDIEEQFKEDFEGLDEYRESCIRMEMTYVKAQIGDYPPPNVEVDAYWEWKVVKTERFEDDPNYKKVEDEVVNIAYDIFKE